MEISQFIFVGITYRYPWTCVFQINIYITFNTLLLFSFSVAIFAGSIIFTFHIFFAGHTNKIYFGKGSFDYLGRKWSRVPHPWVVQWVSNEVTVVGLVRNEVVIISEVLKLRFPKDPCPFLPWTIQTHWESLISYGVNALHGGGGSCSFLESVTSTA